MNFAYLCYPSITSALELTTSLKPDLNKLTLAVTIANLKESPYFTLILECWTNKAFLGNNI